MILLDVAMHILLVDDDPLVRDPVSDALRDGGFDVTTAESGTAALAALSGANPDVVVTDIRMPDGDGLELLETLRERAPDIDVVMLTAFDDMQTVVRAMRAGAFDFLTKPLDPEDLLNVLHRAGRDRKLRERARRSRENTA